MTEQAPYIYGSYRVGYCEPKHNGERANFAVILWGDDYPPRVRLLTDWTRFEAFTGWGREICEGWARSHQTAEALANYARREHSSLGIAMSCLKWTEPCPAALNARDEPLDGLARHFLIEPASERQAEDRR